MTTTLTQITNITTFYIHLICICFLQVQPSVVNLSGKQLAAPSTASIYEPGGKRDLDEIEESQAAGPSRGGKKKPKLHDWRQGDLTADEAARFNWTPVEDQNRTRDRSPTTLFELFFDDELCNDIVSQSVLYAQQKGDHTFRFSVEELKVFLGILILSGYHPLPRRRMYWSPDEDIGCAAVQKALSRRKFESQMKYLHLADNTRLPANDRYGKLRPYFYKVNKNFLKNFVVEQRLSVDESMVKYFGHHPGKQFLKGKPIRFGYKLWSLCTPKGYLIQFDPYQGAGRSKIEIAPHLGLGGSVVKHLVSTLPKNPYIVYTDNFFTSITLLEELATMGVGLTGTIRANRTQGCPLTPPDRMKKNPRGSMEYKRTKDGVVVCRWNDNSIVTAASTADTVQPPGRATRWFLAERERKTIDVPGLIKTYNQNMGGVDRLDQNVATYRISIRSKKWWWSLFTFIIDAAVNNAWLLYRGSLAHEQNPMDLLAFRREISRVYLLRYTTPRLPSSVGGMTGPRRGIESQVPNEIRYDGKSHFMGTLDKRKRCRQCGKKAAKNCRKCTVPLHVKCFELFHTSRN